MLAMEPLAVPVDVKLKSLTSIFEMFLLNVTV